MGANMCENSETVTYKTPLTIDDSCKLCCSLLTIVMFHLIDNAHELVSKPLYCPLVFQLSYIVKKN